MRRELGTLVASAREAGSTTLRRYAQLLLSDSAFGLGDWEAAERDAEEAVAIADDFGMGGPLSIALVMRGQVHAAKGEESEARADIGLGAAHRRAARLPRHDDQGSSRARLPGAGPRPHRGGRR